MNPTPGGGISNAISILVGSPPSPPSGVGVVALVSTSFDGKPGNGAGYTPPAISADGRYVAFQSDSTNLVPGPASGFTDIYVRDTCVGAPSGCTPTTTRVSVANDGSLPNGNSRTPAISAQGRYVAFDSSATNLFAGSTQTNGAADVFVRDTCIGALSGCTPSTTLASVASDGSQPNDDSRGAAINSDGRYIAFSSVASNLVPGDTNNMADIFLRDTCTGAGTACTPATSLQSIASDGSQSNGPSAYTSISADGRYISFRTSATNLVSHNSNSQVVLRDTCFGSGTGCTPNNRSLFVGYAGDAVNGAVDNLWVLSANARFSGFGSEAKNLIPGDSGQNVGSFVYDDCIGGPAGCIPHTVCVSVAYNDGPANNGSTAAVSSEDGNYAVFVSIADNLLPYPYRSSAVYVRSTCANADASCVPTTYLLSFDSSSGIQANSSYSDFPAITADGRYAVFVSNAANWPGALQSNGKNQVWLARVR
jgi:Tol biopolymer transport system component